MRMRYRCGVEQIADIIVFNLALNQLTTSELLRKY